jgi:hypothetical protein
MNSNSSSSSHSATALSVWTWLPLQFIPLPLYPMLSLVVFLDQSCILYVVSEE